VKALPVHADAKVAKAEDAMTPQVALRQIRSGDSLPADASRPLDELWLTNVTVQGDSERPLSGLYVEGRVYAEGVPHRPHHLEGFIVGFSGVLK
jgi:hypothetical protein